MPKVSVIVPVYNGEVYLRQCLDSVCAQTLEEIEIICVDDGSTDGSWEILEEYRDKDSRFRLIRHEENRHIPIARNTGFAQARGKYVIFWDGDDIFEPCALERLYRRAEETGAEICVGNHDLFDNTTGKRYPSGMPLNLKRIPEGDTFNRFTNPEYILSFTNVVVWDKLLLRQFLIEKDIKFSDYQPGEDVPFTFVTFCAASKIATVNEILVHHRWNNPESIMGKISQLPGEEIRAFKYAVDQLIERDIVPVDSLRRQALGNIRIDFQFTATEADFMNVFKACNEGEPNLFQKCDILEREPGYYGADGDELVKHLLHDTPGDLMAFMMHDLWKKNRVNATNRRGLSAELKAAKAELKAELKAVKAELKAAKAELEKTKRGLQATKENLAALQNSRSFRLGRALLFLPRKIRDLFRAVKGVDNL